MVDIKSCHNEGGLLLLWVLPEGRQPLLWFAILIITIYDGNNCFILPQATLGKIVLHNLRHVMICLFSNLQERVVWSLVLCVCYVDCCLSFCSFVLCVVCTSSIPGFWLILWYLQTFGHCIVCTSAIPGFWLLPLWYLQSLFEQQ